MLNIYKSLVKSSMLYRLSSYGCTFKIYWDRILNLQMRILKTIVPKNIRFKYKKEPDGLLKCYNIIPVHKRVKLQLLLENYFFYDNQINHSKFTSQVKDHKIIITSTGNFYGTRTTNYSVLRLKNKTPTETRNKINNTNIKHITKIIDNFNE